MKKNVSFNNRPYLMLGILFKKFSGSKLDFFFFFKPEVYKHAYLFFARKKVICIAADFDLMHCASV